MAETTGNEAKQSRLTPNRQGLYAIASKYSVEAIESLYKLMKTSRNENVKLGASKALLDKALPDLKAMEITGDMERPIGVVILPSLKHDSTNNLETSPGTTDGSINKT